MKSRLFLVLLLCLFNKYMGAQTKAWEVIKTPFSNCQNIFFWQADSGFAFTSDSSGAKLFATYDGAFSWTLLKSFPDTVDHNNPVFDGYMPSSAKSSTVFFIDKSTIYISGPKIRMHPIGHAEYTFYTQDVFCSVDGGKGWTIVKNKYDDFCINTYKSIIPIHFFAKDSMLLLAGVCNFYYSFDNEKTVTPFYRSVGFYPKISTVGNGIVMVTKESSLNFSSGIVYFRNINDLTIGKSEYLDTIGGIYDPMLTYAPPSGVKFAKYITKRSFDLNSIVEYILLTTDGGKTFRRVYPNSSEYEYYNPYVQLNEITGFKKCYINDSILFYYSTNDFLGVIKSSVKYKVIDGINTSLFTDMKFAPDNRTGYISTADTIIYKTTTAFGIDTLSTSMSGIRLAKKLQSTELTIYPNPASDWIIITNSESQQNFTYSIYSLQGKLLLSGTTSTEKNTRVDISELLPGSYLIKLNNNFQKIVVFK